jgi:branched-chain amino acid transport system substrate-binding protein
MKSAGVDAFSAPIDGNTALAVVTAAKQTGVNLKVAILATGYGQAFLDDAQAVASAQGAYFAQGEQVPVELHTPATLAEQAAFKQYAGFTGVPGFDWTEGYVSADLLIKGIEVAGQNPTRQSFVTNLRQVTNYDASGLLPDPINYRNYTQIPAQRCSYYEQLQGNQFVLATPKPICGGIIP